ncbi:MAG TPA: GNAT family N-acetyltransferase [Pirellulales bacterium]|nr:GNAT family N-acetyltransferase [Pirellulales bacterium]
MRSAASQWNAAPVLLRGLEGRAPSPGNREIQGDRVELNPACVVGSSAGDHAAIHRLLLSVFHAPSLDGFHASLDDPFYEPRNRLVVKRGEQIVSHLHLTERTTYFGGRQLPAAHLAWLATLPEFRGCGYGSQLLGAADCVMVEGGAALGLLSTRLPHFFRRAGWAVCGRHSHARAGSRDLLAQLSAAGLPPCERPLNIRPWRQVELPALMALYERNQSQAFGAYQRSEAYWRWLVSRKGFDHIYVAFDGPGRCELDLSGAPIVGYVITQEDRILELMADPAHPSAAEQLLARACGDAIERDDHAITLYASPGHRLLELFERSGGAVCRSEIHQGEVFMAKLLDPLGFLQSLCGELHSRAAHTGLERPCELGISLEGEKCRLVVSRRSVKLARGKLGRSYLRLSAPEFTRLVLGHLDVGEAAACGRLRASTRHAAEIARALFPRLPFWRSPLDELVV